MNLERVGREDGQGNRSKAECKSWWKNCEWDTTAYNAMFLKNCETFEEILTAIGPVITKKTDRKTILNYHTRGQTRKTIIDYHEEFGRAQSE